MIMIGKTISHYQILEKLGAGGMGVVYKAQDTKLKRLVALKFLSRELTSDADSVDRFMNEAQTASSLDHSNVCTIYEINETEDGQLFIAMAFYDGETLKQKIEREELSVNDTIKIIIQMAEGLERAHDAGIVHRDIKPENVIITKYNEIKIVDFGLAKLSYQTRVTKTGMVVGTMAYMSPEQLQNINVDHRTDIWSLGVTLHEMLTGELPFQGDYSQAIMYAINNEQPQELQDFRPELSLNLQTIIDRSLEKNPADRYQSVHELIEDLQGLSGSSQVENPSEATKSNSKKISFLTDYRYDILISYEHIDNQPLTEAEKGWITSFHKALEIRLEQLLGSDIKIWCDNQKVRKASSNSTHKAPLPNAAIFISIVSPRYIKSTLCMQEVKEFYKIAEQGKGLWIDNKARIFKAIKTYVCRESQPMELQGIPDYEFYLYDTKTGRPQEFWPGLGTKTNKNFWIKLEDISYDIYQLMEVLKTGEKENQKIQIGSHKATIYLTETTYDLINHRDRIKRQLEQRGYRVLPDRQLPLNADDLEKQVRTDLERCSFSIHLIGQNYGVVPEGETHSIPEIQHHLVLDRNHNENFSQFIWIPPGLQTQDERQQRFIDSLTTGSSVQICTDLLQTSLDEFKTYIVDKLSEEPKSGKEKISKDNLKRIYLQCDQKDLDATAPLEEYLYDQEYEIRLPAFDGDESDVFSAHKENLLLCDGTIIYYGYATDSWLSTKLADLQKIAGYGRSKPIRAKAIYMAGPITRQKERFRTREALAIKNYGDFSPDVLTPFLNAINNGHGEKS